MLDCRYVLADRDRRARIDAVTRRNADETRRGGMSLNSTA